jgi:phospholipid transport system substrate-binding protein
MMPGTDMTTSSKSRNQQSRRGVLLMFAAIVGATATNPVRAASNTDAATGFMTKAVAELSAVVNGSGSMPEKAAGLQTIIERMVDVTSVGRFCLGRFWRMATPEQQKDYIEQFHRVLVSNITSKVGEYAGVDISIQRTFTREDGIVVSSQVARPNNAPAKVDWLISTESGQPLIIDVIAEGTSLRLTQRNDYSAFLSRNNNDVGALITALKQQTVEAAKPQ